MSDTNKGIRVGIDDFISVDTKIPDVKISKSDKLMDFSNIKVAVIDPRVSNEVLKLTSKIRDLANSLNNIK